ncbi:HpcH/HpaI aldolase/citrate lyase family protein [Undibacterium fentianense]|uniref:CoA ester lyase n=1 Tax=Undibacterium fentianense TaxID=2828728 RepID=A0A941E0E5_9BURK|nr:aldolase/citrate lyase family protein [Undibacterium fentianense]MBR7798641.1 CoA ester lyase [Undibacterium fentianense]
MHPSQALFEDQLAPIFLPACDHYAGSEKLMLKSLNLQNDLGPIFDITFDCEDGAAIGNELAHIQMLASLIGSDDNQFNRIGVRVHHSQHPSFQQDLQELLRTEATCKKLAYIVLPKINSVEEVNAAIDHINQLSLAQGRAQIPIHVLIETQAALAQVQSLAANPQVECLSFGIMDFVSSHWGAIPASAMRSPAQFTHPLVTRAKLEISAACHLHGKVPSHSVTTDFKDPSVTLSDATRANQEFAYTRMWSIHPSQIKPILKAMAPRSAEINEASAILLAAQANQWGPIEMHGRLHDRASYRYYWTVLKKASISGVNLPEGAQCLV